MPICSPGTTSAAAAAEETETETAGETRAAEEMGRLWMRRRACRRPRAEEETEAEAAGTPTERMAGGGVAGRRRRRNVKRQVEEVGAVRGKLYLAMPLLCCSHSQLPKCLRV